jgi:3-phytase
MRLHLPFVGLLLAASACVEPATDRSSPALSVDDDDPFVVTPYAATPALHEYDDAPRHPNADDPAIWVPRRAGQAPLVIGVLKNGGIQVFDLAGDVVQELAVAHRPPMTAEDPASPGPQPDPGTSPCPLSDSGETYSRYNNVAIAYDVPLRRAGGGMRRTDVVVVTDRGCDALRFFAIEPGRAGGPLVDVTVAAPPRVFPARLVQPSALQSPGEATRYEANPVDDQSTAYGVAVFSSGANRFHVAVTQRSRSVLGVVDLVATADGRVSYARRAEIFVDPSFRIRAPGGGWMDWTPCREDAVDDPQFEGLVFDEKRRVLFASQEVVGVWAIPFDPVPSGYAWLRPSRLVERATSFGAPYWAVPDDGEYECEDEAPAPLPEGTVGSGGNASVAGDYLEPDVEGVALVRDRDGDPEQLLVSSQGSDTFHAFDIGRHHGAIALEHDYAFQVDGASATDGLEVVTSRLPGYPGGLLVVHNGSAPPPISTDPVNGYEYEESTQFLFVDWRDVAP